MYGATGQKASLSLQTPSMCFLYDGRPNFISIIETNIDSTYKEHKIISP